MSDLISVWAPRYGRREQVVATGFRTVISLLVVVALLINCPLFERSLRCPDFFSGAILLAADPADLPQSTKVPDAASIAFFEKRIRPLLISKCVECHGEQKQKGGLRLDNHFDLRKGGDAGPLISPENPPTSLLLEVISYQGDLKMPPKSKLTDQEIADLTRWVKLGAPWPEEPPKAAEKQAASGFQITPEQRSFWAFQPIADVAPPEVTGADWVQSPLDRFVLAELESKGLKPAPAADKRTLIRRITLDLTGIPPTRDEVAAFIADTQPGALERVVDRLLDSPRYGEKWARHWLDVARYADSNGLDENLAYANAFRYRDYVVRALNQDKPYSEFVREQIAGDLLPASGDDALQKDRLIATGFLCLGAKMLAEDDPVKMQMDIIDEQVDTIGRAFLGMTLGCARCHDHKYDPLSQADYYALGGIFKSTKTMDNFSVVARWQERPLANASELAVRDAHQASLDAEKQSIERMVKQANDALIDSVKKQLAQYLLAATHQLKLNKLSQQAKPFGDSPELTSIPGLIALEAEDYLRGNVTKDRDNYGKNIGVLVNRGQTPNFVEYEIQIPQDALYQVELRYSAAGSRPCQLSVNGKLIKADAAGQKTGTWYPDSQKWFVEGIFPFKAGVAVVRLEQPQFFPHIDKLLFTPVSAVSGGTRQQPLELASLAETLHAGFVQQFAVHLEKSEKEPQSLWRTWHQFLNEQKGEGAAATDGSVESLLKGASVLGQPARPADSLQELAERYATLFLAADRAWMELKATPEGKNATRLPDVGLEAFRAVLYEDKGILAVPKDAESGYSSEMKALLAAARENLKRLENSLPKFPEAMAVSDSKPENLKIHIRGSHLTLGAEVTRQYPEIFSRVQATPVKLDTSGRLELANWLVSTDHPLTARVMVNRVWQWHFGEGLVRSPDNFGKLGERPTHPQLLDWLAHRFMEDGWSLKKLHRRLLLSATYQQGTRYDAAAFLKDPENRLLWRMNRRRMEVEELRDSLLMVTGGLDDSMGGTQLTTPNRQYVTSTANVNPVVYQNNRRSIYLPVVRSALFELFQAFDFADPSVLNGRRDQTTVAPQALFMMNSAFVLEQSRRMAQTLQARSDLNSPGKIQLLYESSYGRTATQVEVDRAQAYLTAFQLAASAKPKTDALELRSWASLCRAVLAANEFLYIE